MYLLQYRNSPNDYVINVLIPLGFMICFLQPKAMLMATLRVSNTELVIHSSKSETVGDPALPWWCNRHGAGWTGCVQLLLFMGKKRQACSKRCASLLSCVTIDPHSDFYFWLSFQDLSDCRLPLRTWIISSVFVGGFWPRFNYLKEREDRQTGFNVAGWLVMWQH